MKFKICCYELYLLRNVIVQNRERTASVMYTDLVMCIQKLLICFGRRIKKPAGLLS